jgi:hypothetical protein
LTAEHNFRGNRNGRPTTLREHFALEENGAEPEVGEADVPVVVQQQILELEIAMDHMEIGMEIFDHTQELKKIEATARFGERRIPARKIGERAAGREFLDNRYRIFRVARFKNVDGKRMVKHGGDGKLA